MKLKALVIPALFASGLLASNQALARSDMTPEQLAKARTSASQLNPPVDFDALMDEADKLGVKCEGDLTLRYKIKMCSLKVDNAKLDEEYKAMGKEIKRTLDETKQIVKEKQK